MESNAFAPIAILQLPSYCRLLASACSPDKDLVVLISRLGGKDRMALWKLQGSKKWEVDVGCDENNTEAIVGLAWSPSGQSIAVAHDPPRVTLHSVQDGHEERSLPVVVAVTSPRRSIHITGIWWFQEEKTVRESSIPDIFKRNDLIVRNIPLPASDPLLKKTSVKTGTAHAILKYLPLLDHLADDDQKATATDLFAFQGSQTRSTPKSSVPEVIISWPTLLPDSLAASMSSSPEGFSSFTSSAEAVIMENGSDLQSILVIADDLGHLHCFIDGSYPLGAISLGSELSTRSLFKHPNQPVFFSHPSVDDSTLTDLQPSIITLPLLQKRSLRDLAQLSSTARSLVWYSIRVVKEMRAAWFGSDTFSGARELGPKWTRALETKEKEQYGIDEPNPMMALTCLLVTGRPSDALADFLGSSQQTSERVGSQVTLKDWNLTPKLQGIQKWEMTVVDALVKLRDFSEKRVAPACQRLHLVLEEIQGWSHLPQYSVFELAGNDIRVCLELASRAIVISGWLAAIARRELVRFKEFIKWLTFASTVSAIIRETVDNPLPPRHDILEVNNYFMSGLVVSSIDKWFMGPVPQFSTRDLGVPTGRQNLAEVLIRARSVVKDPAQMAWRENIKQQDLSHLDRNLDALIQELATRCQRIFVRAAGAVARSAVVTFGRDSVAKQAPGARPSHRPNSRLINRERIVGIANEPGCFMQYLALQIHSDHRSFVCLVRVRYEQEAPNKSAHIAVAMLECYLGGETQEHQDSFDLLEADFFDDESMVIVYRLCNTREIAGPSFLGTFSYNDLDYQTLQHGEHEPMCSREDLMAMATKQWKEGQLRSGWIGVGRSRELETCNTGEVGLAVNGRVGRRVACVLEGNGGRMEILDLEPE